MRVLADPLLQLVDSAFAVDAHRRVSFWNSACEQMLGIPAHEAIGRPCMDVLQACDGSGTRFCRTDCSVARLVHGGAAPKAEPLWLGQKDGARRPLWLSVILVPSQWRGVWTVVHLLRSREPTARTRHPEQTAAGKYPGGARSARHRNGPGLPPSASLTARELEILRRLAHGQSTPSISRALCISAVTVRNHIQHLIAKLGLHSQIEAVAYAYRNNLVQSAAQREPAPYFAGGGVQ